MFEYVSASVMQRASEDWYSLCKEFSTEIVKALKTIDIDMETADKDEYLEAYCWYHYAMYNEIFHV